MNQLWNTYIRRTIEYGFTQGYSATAKYVDGQKYDPADASEYVVMGIDGPIWRPSANQNRIADITIDVRCFCRQSADVHRIDEIAGAVAAALMRRNWAVKNYPAAEPAQLGTSMVRIFDCKQQRMDLRDPFGANAGVSSGVTDVPMEMIIVTAEAVCLLAV